MVINRMKALVFYFVIRLYGYKFLDLWEIIHVYYTFYYHWHIDCVWLSLVHLQVNFGTCICIPCNIHVQMYMKVGWESIYTVTPHIYANLYKSWISQFFVSISETAVFKLVWTLLQILPRYIYMYCSLL